MKKLFAIAFFQYALSINATILYVSQSGVSPFTVTNSLAGFSANTNRAQTNVFTGTLTNSTTFSSGTPGSPVYYVWATGAKFSAPTWANGSSIISGGVHDVVIDGGANGVVEATSNRVDLVWVAPWFTNTFYGLDFTALGNVAIKNLTFLNFCPRASNRWNLTTAPQCIRIGGTGTNVSVYNCNITNTGNGIVMYPQTGVSTNWQAYSNNIENCSWGIYMEPGSGGALNYRPRIWRNHINNGVGWDSGPGGSSPFHQDGIIHGSPFLTSSNIEAMIYWNWIGPNSGYESTTSAIYLESTQSAQCNQRPWIFGNVFVNAAGQLWNSGINNINASGARIYNNTYAVKGLNAAQTAIGLAGGDGATSAYLVNNLMCDVLTTFYLATISTANVTPTNGLSKQDFNYYCFGWGRSTSDGGFGVPGSNQIYDYATWKALFGFAGDTNSILIYSDPTYTGMFPARARLDTNAFFAPLTNDTVVVGHGTNLTALADALGVPELKYDINGVLRTNVGNWTIGAFELPSTNSPPPPPPPDTNTVVSKVLFLKRN